MPQLHGRATPARWTWLLWLAMLLPLAQVAGAAHEVSHVERVRPADSQKALHIAQCDLCVVAAAVAAGGAASAQAGFVLADFAAAAVSAFEPAQPRAAHWQLYSSRAPPSFLL